MKGFAISPEQRIRQQLEPIAKSGDYEKFVRAMGHLAPKHGKKAVSRVAVELMQEYRDLRSAALDELPEAEKNAIYGQGFDAIAQSFEDAGLRLEDNLRVTDGGYFTVSEAGAKLIAGTGCPIVPPHSTFPIGLTRDPFFHELTEMDEATDSVNSWGFASVLISGALGWMDANVADCKAGLYELVKVSAPTADFHLALKRARYDDRALLQLCTWASEGFEAIARQNLENRP